jgi:hypothetical protein
MRRVVRHCVALLLAVAAFGLPRVADGQSAVDEISRIVATLPPGLFDISDLDVVTEGASSIVATGTITLLGSRTNVLVATSMARGSRNYLIGLRPDDWQLSKAVPGLALPALDGMTLSNVGLVITGDSVSKSAGEMSSSEFEFYSELLHADDFEVRLRPGINLFASIPVDKLPAGHPLLAVMDALGIEKGVVRIQGTLGKSLTMLANPAAGGADVIRDLFLRAELPPMRPKGSPEWFRSGQLALELTGDPSMRLVGEMNVRIQQDELAFFLAAALAREGISLSGGLKADAGWNQPFGIQWLTLYKVVLKIGITPVGSVQLGFGADLVIGEKDMAVAVAIAISPAGAPTNFIFAGESEAGFGLSDLAALQAKMAAAREAAQAATGASGPLDSAQIPLDALPPVEFRGVALKFAPKDEPDLGVQRGMAVKGRMLLASTDGSLKDIASVDVNVGEDGMWVRGTLAAFQVGPLTWQDAQLDLTATRDQQRLRIAGDVELLGSRQKVDLDFSRTQLRFNSETRLYGLFTAKVDALAALDLRQPKFRLHAVAESELSGLFQPMVSQGAQLFVNANGVVIRQADIAVAGLRVALARADATVEELRAALERQRTGARETLEAAQTRAGTLQRATAAARSRRDQAYDLWSGTPVRQLSLKAERRNAWLAAVATYNAAAARSAAQAAVVAAARRMLDALPPVDQSIAVMTATAAARALRTQLETAQQKLETLRETHAALVAALEQGGTLFALTRGEVTADLEAFTGGQALEWRLTGVFVNTPFDLRAALDFSEPAAAAGALLSQLIHR